MKMHRGLRGNSLLFRFQVRLRSYQLQVRRVGSGSPLAVVMLNMGGPSSLDGLDDGVHPFLKRLFQDGEIIKLGPFQIPLVCIMMTARTSVTPQPTRFRFSYTASGRVYCQITSASYSGTIFTNWRIKSNWPLDGIARACDGGPHSQNTP